MSRAPRIALVHAVAVAMAPVHESFARLWPEAECVDLLDTSLSPDRAREEGLSAALAARIRTLADYAVGIGSAGILFTCSAFGEAIAQVAERAAIPVLKPNEAMFAAALAVAQRSAGGRIGMLATFPPSVDSMEAEFRDLARAQGVAATIETICVPQAMAALQAGDAATHNARLAAAAAPRLEGCAAVLLAHFSTSRAQDAVAARVTCPVLTAPSAAVATLRSRI